MAAASGSGLDPVASLHRVARLQRGAGSPAAEHLSALYNRMLGELVGDLDLLLTGLDPAFELSSEDGSTSEPSILDHDAFTARMAAYVRSPVVMWMAWEQLAATPETISGYGTLVKVSPDETGRPVAVVSSKRCAVFLDFDRGRLRSERIFAGASVTRSIATDDPAATVWFQGRERAAKAAREVDHRIRRSRPDTVGGPRSSPDRPTRRTVISSIEP
ncbi:hypothetical protein ACLBYD_26980 [Rhodococcus sp. C26F]